MKTVVLIFLLYAQVFSQIYDYDISELEKRNNSKLLHSSESLYPGDDNIDVLFYKLKLNISYRPDYLIGEVVISAKSLTNNLSSVFIDLNNSLNIDSILLEGQRLDFTHYDDLINIFIPPVNNSAIFSLTIYYQGLPGSSFTFGENNGKPAIYHLSEPYGSKDWWPCKDTPADKADSSEVWLTVREDLTAVSNGTLIEVINNGDTKTFKWKNHYPIAHYLISLAVSDYVEYIQYFVYPLNIIMPVVHYIYPENFDNIKPELDKTVEMLHIFSDLFGPYPFLDEKYGHAEFGWGGGMEYQTISSMGAFNENIISHELAHQWFGDKITCRDWQNIWLNEGFATYSTGLYYEKKYGRDAYKNYIDIQMANAKRAAGSLYVENISSIQEIFNGLRTYSKGAVVLHQLRGVTGDSLFFRILKAYADHPSLRYGTAVTEDFRTIAESIYGSSLEYFFNQWVYGVNFPKYKAGWDYTLLDNNTYKINLQIEQQLNDAPRYFTMPLNVKIKTLNTDTTVVLFNDAQLQQFEIFVSSKPVDLIIDPENYILKEILYTNGGNEQLPREYLLEQNYPNPFNNNTIINFSVPVTPGGEVPVKIRLYDITGREVGTLYSSILSAGNYSININTADIREGIVSGIYIYTLEADGMVLSRKMTLLK